MERIEILKLVENVGNFKNYWELYAFAKQVFDNSLDFNSAMRELRVAYLKLLPPVHNHH